MNPINYENGKYVTKIKLYLLLIQTTSLFILIKELNQIIIGKWPFFSIKGHLCLTKGHWDNPEGPVEVEFPPTGSCFWHVWFKLRKRIFSKKGTFNEVSDPRTLYLSKIGPVKFPIFSNRTVKLLTLNMNIIFPKIFRGLAWLAMHGPYMDNYTLVKVTKSSSKTNEALLVADGHVFT